MAGLALDLGLGRIGLMDITPPALVLAGVGVAYLLTVGRWLTPVRETTTDLIQTYELRDYLTALVVEPDSAVVGKSLAESRFADRYGLDIVLIERGDARVAAPDAGTVLQAGDVLVAEGAVADIAAVEEQAHLTIAAPPTGLIEAGTAGAGSDAAMLAELLVPPRSFAVGRSVGGLRFRQRYGVAVLGIRRHGASLRERARDVKLAAGDLLLVRGAREDLMRIHEGRDFALLGVVDRPVRRPGKLGLAVAILTVVVALAALDVLPILVSAVLGVVAMFVTGCVTPQEAYDEVDWMVYQTNTFVYGPGGYRFGDYFRVGGPLNLLMLVAAALVIPVFFPF